MHLKKVVLLHKNYPTREHYPFNLDIFNKTGSVPFSSPVTFFIGENGTGKSTLLKAIALKCGIHIWQPEERGRYEMNPFEDQLYHYVNVEWKDKPVPGDYTSSELFKYFSQSLDDWAAVDPEMLQYFGGRSLLTQSHGQALMSYFRSSFQRDGLFLLDEPETALSPKKQIELLRLLDRTSRAGRGQFIIASHSPILLACPGARVYCFDHTPLKEVR
ncbi:MAG: AAA family ATPase, partial [bacterium]|nr:AAA family ATPase [bacterium]